MPQVKLVQNYLSLGNLTKSKYVYDRFNYFDIFPDASPSRSSPSMSSFGESDKAIIVESLLKFGALPDTYNSEGQAALHLAVLRGYTDVAKKLIQGGANPNICDTKVRV